MCCNRACSNPDTFILQSFEVTISSAEKPLEQVKTFLCPSCAIKLNYVNFKRKIENKKHKRDKKEKKDKSSKKKHIRRRRGSSESDGSENL
jgi:transcription initiation factor IIE alpha subunit